MQPSTLRYEIEPKIYGISSEFHKYKTKINNLVISERFEHNSKYKSIGDGLGDYKVIIEKEVNNDKELQTAHFEVLDFVDELDKAWVYACGHPLTKKHFAFMSPHITVPDGKLSGWKSNYREVEKEINKGKAHATISLIKLDHASFPYWPLEVAINVRKEYLQSTEQAQTLVDLHYYAHKVKSGYAMLFFLAKSLEFL